MPRPYLSNGVAAMLCLVCCLLFLTALAHPGAVQACSGSVTLDSQAEVDAFAALGCTEVTGSLTIEGADITNVDALQSLTSVGGFLTIARNPMLTNVNGLFNLTQVGARLFIGYNDALTNVDGLINLAKVGIVSLNPWPAVITDNGALTNVDGLHNLKYVAGTLFVQNNIALSDCCGFFTFLDEGDSAVTGGCGCGGQFSLGNNGPGCTNPFDILSNGPCADADIQALIDEVKNALGIPKVSGVSGGNGLVAKLEEALFHVENGRYHVTVNKLRDFIDQVNASVNSGVLTATQGQEFIDSADWIILTLRSLAAKNSGQAATVSIEKSTWGAVKKLYR